MSYLESCRKEALVAAGKFNQHAVYVLGEPIVVPDESRVTVALSSENLLLNAYRQQDFGVPSYLCVDTTHRLVREGHSPLLHGSGDCVHHSTLSYNWVCYLLARGHSCT